MHSRTCMRQCTVKLKKSNTKQLPKVINFKVEYHIIIPYYLYNLYKFKLFIK